MVYILSKNGQPIMPTKNHRKVRLLLESGKAKVAKRTPFTIQLLTTSKTFTQAITLGVDAGSKTIGMSACTDKQELFSAEVKPRNDVVKHLSARREFRRARRNRKTRHRKPRFENRVRSKHKGWLAPSVEVKIQNHITPMLKVCKILPITKVIVETAEFDTQRLKAMLESKPLPVGTDYQLGEMYDSYNVRQYVLFRDGYTCRYCKKHSHGEDGIKLHVHHLETRKTGSNAPSNLITLCEKCHDDYHKGKIKLDGIKVPKSYRDATFMGIMRKTLIQRLHNKLDIPVLETQGYITKYLREKYDIPKSHTNDAKCIAGYPTVTECSKTYLIKPVRQHNRQLHKAKIDKGGTRKSNQSAKYTKGFRLFDKVLYNGIECFVWGRRATGSFALKLLDGTKVTDGVTYRKLQLLERSSNYLVA